MTGLKQKFLSGIIWESFGRFTSLGVQFLVIILISRILSPEEFGVIGLLTIFIALSTILLDSGFSQALIQKKNATKLDLSSVYYFNIVLGIIIYLIMFFTSPYIAAYYNIPELTNYSRVLFFIVPINSFGLIQNVIIQKELDFKKTSLASLVSVIFSGIIGVCMAYSGFGIWSLVVQQLSLSIVKTLMYILQRRWVPILKFSFSSIKEMFGFSMNLMFHSIVNVTMKNIYTLFIGKHFSISEVGYYNQANKFEEISASTLTQIVIKVSFPALVQQKDNPTLLKKAYSNIFTSTIFVITPLMFFLIIIGESLFRILLTEKWLPAVPYFRILCIYGMFIPIVQISYNIYKLYRKGKLLLIVDSSRHLLVVISIFFTINFTIDIMLIGLVSVTFLMSIINLYLSGKLIKFSILNQLKELIPYYLIALLSAIIVYFIPNITNDYLNIIISGGLYVILYLLISHILNLKAYNDILTIIKSLKKKIV